MAFVCRGKSSAYKGHIVISILHLLGLLQIIEKPQKINRWNKSVKHLQDQI